MKLTIFFLAILFVILSYRVPAFAMGGDHPPGPVHIKVRIVERLHKPGEPGLYSRPWQPMVINLPDLEDSIKNLPANTLSRDGKLRILMNAKLSAVSGHKASIGHYGTKIIPKMDSNHIWVEKAHKFRVKLDVNVG